RTRRGPRWSRAEARARAQARARATRAPGCRRTRRGGSTGGGLTIAWRPCNDASPRKSSTRARIDGERGFVTPRGGRARLPPSPMRPLPLLRSWATPQNPVWQGGIVPAMKAAIATYDKEFYPGAEGLRQHGQELPRRRHRRL